MKRGHILFWLMSAAVATLGSWGCADDPAAPVCDEDVADINQDGVVDAEDCALREDGRRYRAICTADSTLWTRSTYCSSTTIEPIPGVADGASAPPGIPLVLTTIGDTLRAYYVNELKRPSEWRFVEAALGRPATERFAFYEGERLVAATSREAWIDLNRDLSPTTNEIYRLDEIFGGGVREPRFSVDSMGRAVIASMTLAGLEVWLDLDGDRDGDPGERILLDTSGSALSVSGTAVTFRRGADGAISTWFGNSAAWAFDPAAIRAINIYPNCARIVGQSCITLGGEMLQGIYPPYGRLVPLPAGHTVSISSRIATLGPNQAWNDWNGDTVMQTDEFLNVLLRDPSTELYYSVSTIYTDDGWTSAGWGSMISGVAGHASSDGTVNEFVGFLRLRADSFAGDACSATRGCADNLVCTSRSVCVMPASN